MGGQRLIRLVMMEARMLPTRLVTGPMTRKPTGTSTKTAIRGTSMPLTILGMYLYKTFSS